MRPDYIKAQFRLQLDRAARAMGVETLRVEVRALSAGLAQR
jgi:hypothetical protein